jgi:hypothetical protein
MLEVYRTMLRMIREVSLFFVHTATENVDRSEDSKLECNVLAELYKLDRSILMISEILEINNEFKNI